MKADDAAPWRERGKRFEIFKPKHESVRPSEWYLPLYAVLRIGKLGRVWRRGMGGRRAVDGAAGRAQTETAMEERRWWSLRRAKPPQAAREDEGWVL